MMNMPVQSPEPRLLVDASKYETDNHTPEETFEAFFNKKGSFQAWIKIGHASDGVLEDYGRSPAIIAVNLWPGGTILKSDSKHKNFLTELRERLRHVKQGMYYVCTYLGKSGFVTGRLVRGMLLQRQYIHKNGGIKLSLARRTENPVWREQYA